MVKQKALRVLAGIVLLNTLLTGCEPEVTGARPVWLSANEANVVAGMAGIAYQANITDNDSPSHTLIITMTGKDSELFHLDPSTHSLSFIDPPSTLNPRDSDHNNRYEVLLSASDESRLATLHWVTITVTSKKELAVKMAAQ